MGKSVTVHCIGQQREGGYMYYAMSRLEIAQQTEKARRRGEEIVAWYSQTKTGDKILGASGLVLAKDIPSVRGAITCPVCYGIGCAVCRGSGITTRKWAQGYQPWQISQIRRELGIE